MSKKYTLEMTEEQAQVLWEALDVYARLGIGQFGRTIDQMISSGLAGEKQDSCFDKLRDIMANAERIFHIGWGHAGIRGAYHEGAKVAYDLCQVVRHRLTHDEYEETGNPHLPNTVWYNEPLKVSEDVPLATMKKVEK